MKILSITTNFVLGEEATGATGYRLFVWSMCMVYIILL